MAIEHITGVGLTTGRTTQQKGHLAISLSLLGEVVVDHQCGFALVHEVLGNRCTGVRSQVLECRRIRRIGRHNHRVIEGTTLTQHLSHLSDRRCFLTDGHVNADDVLILLIEDRVDCDSGLAGLTVANDQLTLTAANGNHRVDGSDAGLHRFMHRLALNDAGSR